MRVLIYIIVSFLVLKPLDAQVFNFDWSGKIIINSIGEKNYNVPEILNIDSYYDASNLPHFYLSEKYSNKSDLEFKILKEKNIQLSQLGDLKLNDIPTLPKYDVGVYKGRGNYTKVIDVIGFYRKGNEVKQILSFEVKANDNIATNRRRILARNANIPSVLDEVNGSFFKISVDTTGVYKITKDFLRNNNIPTDFSPSKFKIYGNGGMMLPENPGDFRYKGLQEVAIQAVGMEDGSFDDNDYFLFYAQGPNGIDRYNNIGEHSINLYETKAYYFINFDSNGDGKRINYESISSTVNQTFDSFDQVLFYEKELTNIYNVGRLWVGESFMSNPTYTIRFNGEGAVENPRLSYGMVGTNARNTSFNIKVNGNDVVQDNFFGRDLERRRNLRNFANTNYPLNIEISVDNSQNPVAGNYLDYIRLNFKQRLNFSNNQLGFRWLQGINENTIYSFRISGTPEFVWDVSDRVNAVQLNLDNGVYKFIGKSDDYPNEFIAFNSNQAFIPKYEKQIENQSLTNLLGIDYVIVTHPDFISQAERLANVHNRISGVTATVVTTEQVYNEFGSGGQDISAIRDFFKYLYDNGSLKYALLFGDTSYDFKDRILNNTNKIPSYQSDASFGLANTFVTDDFFAILDDEDIGLNLSQLDIAIGRLPADNINEANVLVEKTLSYLNNSSSRGSSFGDWRTKVTFVVDDDNPGQGEAFHNTVESKSAQYIEQNYPLYTVEKLYADAFQQVGTSAGLRYPELEKSIVNSIESGTLLLNYFGHGGLNGLAQERIFTQNHVQSLENYNRDYSRLPIMLTVTCEFTVWDVPQISSAGEMMIKNPRGGAVAMLTTSREIGVSYGLNMNDTVIKRLFEEENGKYLPIGEALRRAKIDYSSADGRRLNLMGDPLISLAKPQNEVRIDKINGLEINQFNETIKALDFVSIEGSVFKNGNIDSNFNGNLTGVLFDKSADKKTLNNDGDIDVLEFSEQKNAIYRGSSKVENGKFKFEFYVPKDINFDEGNGKILLYANDNKEDGAGFKNDIKIGGLNENSDVVNDKVGPVVGLYMNNLNFTDGGITDRGPYLLACITDDTGINATGSGIGHDITQLLDGNIDSTTVLNNFFEGGDASPCLNPNVKDYQKGRVLYKLNDLELGEHNITFRVWDINNNSTTETLNFVVMEDGNQKLHINKLLNWPNPFTTQTYFHFEHNCPDVLEVQVQIFSVAGKLVKNIRQTVTSEPFREGYRTGKFDIPWDGLDDYGNKIGKGVYIYKVIVKGADAETCKGQANAIEKLVILK